MREFKIGNETWYGYTIDGIESIAPSKLKLLDTIVAFIEIKRIKNEHN